MEQISKHFNKHPSAVGMSYLQHLRFAMNLSRQTFIASLTSFVHAILPFLFTTSTSQAIFRLNEILRTRLPQNESGTNPSRFTQAKAENIKETANF